MKLTDQIIDKIRELDYIEAKNVSQLAKKLGTTQQVMKHIVKNIEAKMQRQAKQNKYSHFWYVKGTGIVGIYLRRGKMIKEFFGG